jgi:hypothetical protein
MLLVNDSAAGVLLCGDSGFDLPPVAPRQHIEIELTLLPLKVGLQRIGGLVLMTGKEGQARFSFDNLATVVVGANSDQCLDAANDSTPSTNANASPLVD